MKFKLLLQEKTAEIIIYKENTNFSLKLFFVKSTQWRNSDKRSAVVWIHGGGWETGDPVAYIPHCHYFASRNCVSFSVQYRLVGKDGKTLFDCLSDVRSAIRFIRANSEKFGIDPEKIAVIGDSAGGHLATSLATLDAYDDPTDSLSISPEPNIIINCNGVVDLTNHFMKYVPGCFPINDPISEEQLSKAKAVSPIYNLKKGLPPTLNLQGALDKTVPVAMTEQYHLKSLSLGNQSELIVWPDAKHAFLVIGYTATEAQIVRALVTIDEYLVKFKLLTGKPTLFV